VSGGASVVNYGQQSLYMIGSCQRGSSCLACKAVVKIPYMDIQNEISLLLEQKREKHTSQVKLFWS
jgi:hypothetical protein